MCFTIKWDTILGEWKLYPARGPGLRKIYLSAVSCCVRVRVCGVFPFLFFFKHACWTGYNYPYAYHDVVPGFYVLMRSVRLRTALSTDLVIKVFRYSFFGTIPHFLNRLLDSLHLVGSTWNLLYLFVLDWTLPWFTFCENRYFHDNDKRKYSKTAKLKFCAIQISLLKANTNILNCGVWQKKYTRTKKICMFVLK